MVTMHFKICLMALGLTFGIYPMIILNPVDRRFTFPRVITIPNKHVCIVSKATVTGSCCVVLSTGSCGNNCLHLICKLPKPKAISKLVRTFQIIYKNTIFQRNVKRGVGINLY